MAHNFSFNSTDELGSEASIWDLACCIATDSADDDSLQGKGNVRRNSCGPAPAVSYAIDWKLAVPVYEKHALEGHPIAQKNLGTCFFRGWGVRRSTEAATEFYEKAALQNYDVAQYNLGVCHRC